MSRSSDHLSRLEYFAQVAEHGSISRAARQMGVGPSSVSRQLAALEADLGVVLVRRTTRRVGLTEAGRLYLDSVQRILADVELANRAVTELQADARGVLRLSVTLGFCQYRVAPLLPEFMRLHPDLDVHLDVTDRVVDLVEEDIDLAIRIGQLPNSSLIARRIDDGKFALCAAPRYLSQRAAPKRPADLCKHECILYAFPGWQHWRLLGPKPRELDVHGRLQVNNLATLHAVALAGGGLTLLPRWVVADDLESGRLVEVLPKTRFSPYVGDDTGVYALYVERRYLAPKVRGFLDYLIESLRTR